MRLLTPLSILAAVLSLASCSVEITSPADHLFLGDHILTMESGEAVSAVAVVGDRIVWVGDRRDAGVWEDQETAIHELGDKALLPGFIDAHGHVSFTAQTIDMANVASPPVGPVKTLSDLQSELRTFIEDRGIESGDWVTGMGYDDSLLSELRHPNRQDLDAVSTDHPIALVHVSGHLMAVNSKALELAGLDAATPDPAGGHLHRDDDGKTPNGVLEESAAYPIRRLISRPVLAEQLLHALEVYASYGITTVQDGFASPDQVRMIADTAASRSLPVDVVSYVGVSDASQPMPEGLEVGVYANRFKLGGVKMSLDGSPQGKTAYLSQPYHVAPDGQDADYRGYPGIPEEAAFRRVSRFYADGIPILAHANGDAAAQILIEAVEAAVTEHGERDHRTVMIHAQTVREDQLDRMSALGIVPSYFSAHTFYWGDWHRDSVLGPERGSRISPTRTTKDRGMRFTVHNDAPIVPPDMIRLLWATTNRITRSGQELGPEHALNVEEAIVAMTSDAAYQHFEENEKGSIAAGKLADLVVLSRDPREGATTELLDISIVGTMSHGEWVFGDLGADP
jgi:predicted amidohydrolase YtcJ